MAVIRAVEGEVVVVLARREVLVFVVVAATTLGRTRVSIFGDD